MRPEFFGSATRSLAKCCLSEAPSAAPARKTELGMSRVDSRCRREAVKMEYACCLSAVLFEPTTAHLHAVPGGAP